MVDGECIVSCPPHCKNCERITQECYTCNTNFKLINETCVYQCTDDCETCDPENFECIECKVCSNYISFNSHTNCYLSIDQ